MSARDYLKRRKNLMRSMGSNSIAILSGAQLCSRNRDVDYPFRQDSDFYYLTGFKEPEAVAVLVPGRSHGEFVLFCRDRDPVKEQWDGKRLGVAGAVAELGADDAFPITDIDDILPGLMEGKERVFYTMGKDPEFDQQVMQWLNALRAASRAGMQSPSEFIALDHHLHEMRLFKDRSELKLMKRAAEISANAHRRAMQVCRPGMQEYELEAEFLWSFRRAGAEPAYSSIVGGGANACVLHYISNDQELCDGDMVLIDAGAEYAGYAGDITRTFPVNGRFSAAQRDAYEWVLEAQLAAIEKTKSGNHWSDPHTAAVKILVKGMVDLGLLRGKPSQLIKTGKYRKFYMHRTGHWLGMDVHDVGDYKLDGQWRLLEPGMVTTVEPGLYISAGKGVPKALSNIGIRIEDDVVVTRQGNQILSELAPKTVTEIEALMAA